MAVVVSSNGCDWRREKDGSLGEIGSEWVERDSCNMVSAQNPTYNYIEHSQTWKTGVLACL